MGDFCAFRTMVTPVIIEILFWRRLSASSLAPLWSFMGAPTTSGLRAYIWKGVLLFVLGPLGVRIYCEILIIFFRINETLTEIKHALGERPPEA